MPVTSLLSAASKGAGGQSFRQLELGVPQRIDARQSAPAKVGDASTAESPGPSFVDMVKGFVEDVNAHQMHAGKTVKAFVAGEITDVHQVMTAVQEAGLALDLLIEIRNRTQEAFQEIMRIQV